MCIIDYYPLGNQRTEISGGVRVCPFANCFLFWLIPVRHFILFQTLSTLTQTALFGQRVRLSHNAVLDQLYCLNTINRIIGTRYDFMEFVLLLS